MDIFAEHPLTIPQACQIIPGRPVSTTVHRWSKRGIRGVRLQTALIGGRRYTSREAIRRFIAELSGLSEFTDPDTVDEVETDADQT
jgi:hypothetical protein